MPPTRRTSSTYAFVTPESLRHESKGFIDLLIKSSAIDSNFALVILNYKCFGPVASAERYARFTSV